MADADGGGMDLDAIEIDPSTLNQEGELQDLGDDLELGGDAEGYDDDDCDEQNPAELLSVEPQIIMDDEEYADDDGDPDAAAAAAMAAAGMEHFMDASNASMHHGDENSYDGMENSNGSR